MNISKYLPTIELKYVTWLIIRVLQLIVHASE